MGPPDTPSRPSGDEPNQVVAVAADLSPGEAAALDTRSVVAVATAAGAPLSHASILIRSLGIPAVTGVGSELLEVPAGTIVLVDGDAGTVQVDPTSEALERARARQREARRRQDEARRDATTPAVTLDGFVVPVFANVGSAQDARSAVREGCDGVGMLRTEFAFLNRPDPPGEREQYLAYREVAEAIGERPLVVRTLDLGADVPAWNEQPEANPALGNRGIRLALSRGDLLRTQLRAVARLAADRPLGLMFPMVTSVDEVRRAKAFLDETIEEIAPDEARHVDVGITVEVPAAAITADAFAPVVDFFAVGTNDLTQYTLAADRGNTTVAPMVDGLHPAVLRLIHAVVAAAAGDDRSVCVVGELACDPLAVPVLLGLGVSSLSVRPNAVGQVKQMIRAVDRADARHLAEGALDLESAEAVRELVRRRRTFAQLGIPPRR